MKLWRGLLVFLLCAPALAGGGCSSTSGGPSSLDATSAADVPGATGGAGLGQGGGGGGVIGTGGVTSGGGSSGGGGARPVDAGTSACCSALYCPSGYTLVGPAGSGSCPAGSECSEFVACGCNLVLCARLPEADGGGTSGDAMVEVPGAGGAGGAGDARGGGSGGGGTGGVGSGGSSSTAKTGCTLDSDCPPGYRCASWECWRILGSGGATPTGGVVGSGGRATGGTTSAGGSGGMGGSGGSTGTGGYPGVSCGGATCTGGMVCCVRQTPASEACSAASACAGDLAVICDGPDDCGGAGHQCCTPSGALMQTSCVSGSCLVGLAMCHTSSDCPQGQNCCPAILLGYTYRTCQTASCT